MTLLDQLTDVMDAECLSRLGDPIVYQPASQPGIEMAINAYVGHADQIDELGGGTAVTQDIDIRVRVVDVPMPERGDTIVIPQRNEVVQVNNWRRDASGRWWAIRVQRLG